MNMTEDIVHNFKYVWLNQGETAHAQSRGLSYEVLGFLPVSLGKDADYLKNLINDGTDTLLNLGKELTNYKNTGGESAISEKLTYIFPKLTYNPRHDYIAQSSAGQDYSSYLLDYSNHLFKDIQSTASNEMKFVGKDVDTKYEAQEQVAAEGSIQLSFMIDANTFGTYIKDNFYIDAIMFFGRAYNKHTSTDSTSQQQNQEIVPVGLLVYMDERSNENESTGRPYITPSLISDKVLVEQTIVISLLQGAFDITAIQDDENFEQWKEFAGHLHLANDKLSTGSKFLLVDNKVEKQDVADIENIGSLSAEGRTYSLHDRLYMADFTENWDDANDDFASPAMMTCMTSAQNGFKNPQAIFAQVSKYEKGNETVNYWDGVAHSYWTDGAELDDKSIKGSIYSVDWISTKRPGLNLFSNNIENVYVDSAHENVESDSAAFGGGVQLLSTSSFASRYATNVLGSNNYLRGNATSIGSQFVDFYQSGFNDSATYSENRLNNGSVGSMFLNTEYVNITCPNSGDQITTIAADNLSIYNNAGASEKDRRVSVLNGEFQQVVDSNRLLLLNVKGRKDKTGWTYGGASTTTNSIIANGNSWMNSVDKSIAIGDNNKIFGTDSKQKAKQCQVFGSDNEIYAVGTKKGQAQKVTLLGHGLKYDPKQQIFERSPNACKTIIVGQDNNVYTQLGLIGHLRESSKTAASFNWNDYTNTNIVPTMIKQLVVGGWKPSTVRHGVSRYNVAEIGIDNTTVNDAMFTIMDIKGRAIDYSSRGLSVGVQETHNQDAYDYYKYKSLGSINWAKLIQLLHHLEYDVETGTVTYNIAKGRLNDENNQSNYFDDLNGSRNFYDLVRNDNCVSPIPTNFS